MGQEFQINHFRNFLAFASAICKYDGHPYKCHNISETTSYLAVMLMTLTAWWLAIYTNVHFTFINTHIYAPVLKMASGSAIYLYLKNYVI